MRESIMEQALSMAKKGPGFEMPVKPSVAVPAGLVGQNPNTPVKDPASPTGGNLPRTTSGGNQLGSVGSASVDPSQFVIDRKTVFAKVSINISGEEKKELGALADLFEQLTEGMSSLGSQVMRERRQRAAEALIKGPSPETLAAVREEWKFTEKVLVEGLYQQQTICRQARETLFGTRIAPLVAPILKRIAPLLNDLVDELTKAGQAEADSWGIPYVPNETVKAVKAATARIAQESEFYDFYAAHKEMADGPNPRPLMREIGVEI